MYIVAIKPILINVPMKKICLFFLPLLVMGAYAQNFPVAVVDTAQAINQKVVEIFPLLNDYDPDGDTIEIFNLLNPHDGETGMKTALCTISRNGLRAGTK